MSFLKFKLHLNKKDEINDELTQKITADLRQKANENSKDSDNELDFAESSEYVKDFEKTGRFSWVWIVIVLLVVLLMIALTIH